MSTEKIFHDNTQLSRKIQRVITSTWAEYTDNKVSLVPTTAEETAGRIRVDNLERSLKETWEEVQSPVHGKSIYGDVQVSRRLWWLTQWTEPESLYEVVELNEAQLIHADALMTRIPHTCFSGVTGELGEHADLRMVCEALALGGRILVTHNARTMDHEHLNRWVAENRKREGFANDQILVNPDAWLTEQCKMVDSRYHEVVTLKLMVGALWPEDEDAPNQEVVAHTLRVLEKMETSPFSECARQSIWLMEHDKYHGMLDQWIGEVRRRLPHRTRRAENEERQTIRAAVTARDC